MQVLVVGVVVMVGGTPANAIENDVRSDCDGMVWSKTVTLFPGNAPGERPGFPGPEAHVRENGTFCGLLTTFAFSHYSNYTPLHCTYFQEKSIITMYLCPQLSHSVRQMLAVRARVPL